MTGGSDSTLGLWNAALPRVFPTSQIPSKLGGTGVTALSPDSNKLARVGERYSILIQDAKTGATLATLKGHRAVVLQLAFSPDGSRLISVQLRIRLHN